MRTPRLHRSPTILLLTALGVLAVLISRENHWRPQPVGEPAIQGTFCAGGDIPSGRRPPAGLRYWSSWCGDDRLRGALTLGPVTPGPGGELSFFAIGYPRIGSNKVRLENAATGVWHEAPVDNIGERWMRVLLRTPPGWGVAPVRIHAVDDSEGWGAWLAVTEPVVIPAWKRGWSGAITTLAVFLLLGGLFVMWLRASRLLRHTFAPRLALPDEPLLDFAFTALASYLVFWAYWLDARFGTVCIVALHAGACATCLALESRERPSRPAEWAQAGALFIAVGVLYLGLLCLFSSDRVLSDLAAHRFSDWLPVDNALPQQFAEKLRDGVDPRPLAGDWLSSDRPPLQAGWTLLLAAPACAAGASFDTAGQCAGILFQLSWVLAAWMLLRCLGASPLARTAVILALVPTGILFISSTFVWPKLVGGALLVGAFCQWFGPAGDKPSSTRSFLIGGVLAGLAWLSHGGIAFGLLAVAPFALARVRTTGLRPWIMAALAFACLALPWTAYQKFWEPPGNRLLKWHLGGVIAPDDRGTLETIRSAYANEPAETTWQTRRTNTRLLFAGDWRSLLTQRVPDAQHRRDIESGMTFFSMGWWNLGLAAIALALVFPRLRARWPRPALMLGVLTLGWVAVTLAIWVTMMFLPGSTMIIMGSYSTIAAMLPVFAFALWRVHPVLLGTIGLIQVVAFLRVWTIPPNNLTPFAVRTESVVMMVCAAAAMLAVLLRAWRHGTGPTIDPANQA